MRFSAAPSPTQSKTFGNSVGDQCASLGNYDALSHGGGTFTQAIPPAFAA
jgi:hypothetical protein